MMESLSVMWVQKYSIWSACLLQEEHSTVVGRFMIILFSGVGPHSFFTASQISTANSISVLEKLSGEYWSLMLVPSARGRHFFTQRIPSNAT